MDRAVIYQTMPKDPIETPHTNEKTKYLTMRLLKTMAKILKPMK